MQVGNIRATASAMMPSLLDSLEALVAIPSVAFPGYPSEPVDRMADETLRMFRQVGFDNARFMDVPSGYPPIYGEIDGPKGSPTVMLYAHYDVQPAPPEQGWTSDPWTATRKDDGRIYGRGISDDKGGLVTHLGTMRVFDGRPPCSVKLILEGMEETESNLEAFVEAHPELFDCDLFVVCDMGNLHVGEPVLTTALRGDVACVVTVRTLEHPFHSGVFGGPDPDAMIALARLLATLHDENGDVAVKGVTTATWDGADIHRGRASLQRRHAGRRYRHRHRNDRVPSVGQTVGLRNRRRRDRRGRLLQRPHPRGTREDLDAHRARLRARYRTGRASGPPRVPRTVGRSGLGAAHQGGPAVPVQHRRAWIRIRAKVARGSVRPAPGRGRQRRIDPAAAHPPAGGAARRVHSLGARGRGRFPHPRLRRKRGAVRDRGHDRDSGAPATAPCRIRQTTADNATRST